MVDVVFVEDRHGLRIVQTPIIVPVLVRVDLTVARRVYTVNLTGILLSELHENDRTLGDNSVDDECREHYN